MPDVAWVTGSAYAGALNNTTATVTTPAGIATGDYLLAAVFSRYAVTAPTGWTQIGVTSDFNQGGAVTQRITVFRKDTVNSTDSSTAISWVQATTSTNGVGVLYAVARNVSAATVTTAIVSNTVTVLIAPPAQTADAAGQLCVMFGSTMDAYSNQTPTPPSGSTLFSGSGAAIATYRLAGAYQARTTGQANGGSFNFGPSSGAVAANGLGAVTVRLATSSPTPIPARLALPGPLAFPSFVAQHRMAAFASCPSPLLPVRVLARYDFTRQVEGQTPVYRMALTTPTGPVIVPISSWQATLQGSASSYVQCVVPACDPWIAAIRSATDFTVYRVATINGQPYQYEMASATLEGTQLSKGPRLYTAVLTGHSAAFTGDDNPSSTLDRVLTDVRSIATESTGLRVRCGIDWLLRPGLRAVLNGQPFLVGSIGYQVTTSDQYMDVKEAQS